MEKTKRLTRKAINKALAEKYGEDVVFLWKGEGYFYFTADYQGHDLVIDSIYVNKVSDLTLEMVFLQVEEGINKNNNWRG